MRPDMIARLTLALTEEQGPKSSVKPVLPVAAPFCYRSKPLKLLALPVLPVKNSKLGNVSSEPVDRAVAVPPPDAEVAMEERAGLAAEAVPAIYLDAWSRLNCQRPTDISDAAWRRALQDGGLFLDHWGERAAARGWTPGDLFDVPNEASRGGLVWTAFGRRVKAVGRDYAMFRDGETFSRPSSLNSKSRDAQPRKKG